MTTALAVGRPRDARIDAAVLAATVELLEEVGYLGLTVAAVAERAGTTKPAIYRRWPTKAELVHEAAFPTTGREDLVEGDLRDDIRSLVRVGVELLGRPAARAALAGLMAEAAGAAAVHSVVLTRFSTGSWGWLGQRIGRAIAAGQVRPEVEPATVLELIAGATFVATSMRPRAELGRDWIEQVVDIVVGGIAA